MKIMDAAFTRADYDRLPEGFPAQLVEGLLVKEPAPTYGHQALSTRIVSRLLARVHEDLVVAAPSDVVLDELNVYQPDVLVLRSIPRWDVRDVGIPLLAVEILSPSSERRDREVKRKHLLEAGVAEVWLVDPHTRTIEVDDASGRRRAAGDDTLSSTAVPGFELTPPALFKVPRP